MADWVQILSTVGFPIAACAALWYFMLQMLQQNKQENHEIRQEHKEEINALRETLEQNTSAIMELRGVLTNGASLHQS